MIYQKMKINGFQQKAILKSAPDILGIAESHKSKKIISAVKAREKMEKEYERF